MLPNRVSSASKSMAMVNVSHAALPAPSVSSVESGADGYDFDSPFLVSAGMYLEGGFPLQHRRAPPTHHLQGCLVPGPLHQDLGPQPPQRRPAATTILALLRDSK